MEEQWLPVAVTGYEKVYRVSNLGRVKHQATGRILKAGGKVRYLAVYLKRFPDDKGLRREIHRLVAQAFLGDHPDLVVHHKNHDRHDNRVENLEWVTQAQNLAYSRAEGRLHDHRINGRFMQKICTPPEIAVSH